MKWRVLLVCGVLAVAVVGPAYGLDQTGLYKGIPYQEAKTWHEQFLRGEPTRAERLDGMRSLIKASKFGDRGLQRIYNNFEGRYAIDPRIAGVEKTVLLQMSGSASQTKGYRRELLYGTAFYNDPRYSLLEMNRQLKRPWGNTDADIVIRHQRSGLYGMVEVKDYSLKSQSTNLGSLKEQIDKMAREGRRTGKPQFWMNRRDVLPEVQRYASTKGVFALGNVSTGQSPIGKTMSSAEALDAMDREFARVGRERVVRGGGGLAFGTLMLINAAPTAWEDIQAVWDPASQSTQAWLRLGEYGSYTLAGGSMVASGSALLASRFVGDELQGTLYSLGKWGGVASAGLFAVGEGFLIARYVRGDVSSREFRTNQWILATTGLGSFGGSWLGATFGMFFFHEPTWTGGLGGLTGGWLGQKVGQWSADAHYEAKYAKLDQAFGQAVCARYGVN